MHNHLSIAQLERDIPSLHTTEGHLRTSDRYQPISTASVVEKLMLEGFYPTNAIQTNSRIKGKEAFAKHMIRFRRHDFNYTASGIFPEIVLVNSHDGLSSYRLMAGLYRLVCSNGMVAGNEYEEIRVRHQGNIIDNVIEGTYQVVNSFDKMMNAVDTMQSLPLSNDAKYLLAETAHSLRFDSKSGEAFEPAKLLRARRSADSGNDLFSVLNVIQENIIRGGIFGFTRNDRGYLRRTRSRAVKSIDQNIRLNRGLWSTAEKLIPQIA